MFASEVGDHKRKLPNNALSVSWPEEERTRWLLWVSVVVVTGQTNELHDEDRACLCRVGAAEARKTATHTTQPHHITQRHATPRQPTTRARVIVRQRRAKDTPLVHVRNGVWLPNQWFAWVASCPEHTATVVQASRATKLQHHLNKITPLHRFPMPQCSEQRNRRAEGKVEQMPWRAQAG